MKILMLVLACLQLMNGAGADWDAARAVLAMRSGVTLRLHVIAASDLPEDQAVKAPLRDAVRAAYDRGASPERTMLENATILLPRLDRAVQEKAAELGLTGPVTLSIEQAAFDARELDGLTFPAGVYPALLVRVGAAEGHNWWGLLDPELALYAAGLSEGADTAEVRFVWTLPELLRRLLGQVEEDA